MCFSRIGFGRTRFQHGLDLRTCVNISRLYPISDGRERVNYEGIVHRTAPLKKYEHSFLVGQFRAVWAVRSQCIEAVHYLKNARADRYVSALQPIRISCAVP